MIVPTLPRGNASSDALRQLTRRNAERPWWHSHAERGNDQRQRLLRSDAVTVKRGLLLQGSDDAFAGSGVLCTSVIHEGPGFQFRFIAFTDKRKTEEFKGFTVHVRLGARCAQGQDDAHAVLADGEHFD